MSHFDSVWPETLGKEGDYVDNPNDAGGPTRWGITEAVARENGYEGDMRDLPEDVAQSIAESEYWDPLCGEDIAEIAPQIAGELFDTGYNMGLAAPARHLQRALNALNRTHLETPDFPDVSLDGHIGPKTVEALAAFIDKRGDGGVDVMMAALNAQQAVRYLRLAEKRESNEDFVYGWLANRVLL